MNVPSNTRFELSVRAASQFFAAFVGFALTHILDAKPDSEIGQHKLLLLSVSTCLFLRLFFGSANHLWLEYGIVGTKKKLRTFGWDNFFFTKDLIFLTCFGIAAAMIASSRDLKTFFGWAFTLLVFAVVWNIVEFILSAFARRVWPKDEKLKSFGDWGWWLVPNVIQLLAFSAAWVRVAPGDLHLPLFYWDVSFLISWISRVTDFLNGELAWFALFLASFVALILDVYVVFRALEKPVD